MASSQAPFPREYRTELNPGRLGGAVGPVTEILPGVHVIDGASPFPDFLMNVMLIKDKGSNWALLDTGMPGQAPVIEAYLKKEKIAPTSIKKILITHLHLDHTGNLKHLIELTQAKTFSHWIEAAYIAQQPPYIGPGSPPKEAVTIDEPLKDGDSIDVAGGLRIYHTPGHTPGHAAYYHPEQRVDAELGHASGRDHGGRDVLRVLLRRKAELVRPFRKEEVPRKEDLSLGVIIGGVTGCMARSVVDA